MTIKKLGFLAPIAAGFFLAFAPDSAIAQRKLPPTAIDARVPNAQTQATNIISSGVISPSYASIAIAAESGTADDLATVTVTSWKVGDTIKIIADSGDTITLKHGTGNITTDTGVDVNLTDSAYIWLDVTASGVTVRRGGGAGGESFADISALEARTFASFPANSAVFIADSGRAGTFIKVTSDQSALTTADPQKCVFVPSPQDATGASGGYIRKEWLDSKIVRLEWCGGIPDDGNDDTTALNAFFSLVSSQHTLGQIGKGEFEFSTALTRVATANWTVEGAGGYATTLRYTGASTTADLITLGDNSLGALVRLPGNTLRNFRIASDTTMTAGAAIKIEKLMQYTFDGIVLEGWAVGGGYNLYNGLHTLNSDWGTMVNGDIRTSNSGIVATSGAELRLDNMQIVGTGENAIHIAGGFGGFYTGYVGIFGQNFGIKVDTSIVSAGNNQIFISNETTIDNIVNWGVYINDAISSNKSFNFESWSSSQTNAGAGAFAIVNWANGDINITGAKFLSNAGHGIYIDDPSAHVFIDSTTVIAANGGTGIFVNQATSNLYSLAVPYNNTTANTGGYYTNGALPSAFTSPVTISGTDTTKLTMTTTDDTGNSGPVIVAVRDSASPAASDVMGGYLAYGKDSGNNQTTYAGFDIVILDPTDGSEDGEIRFNTMTAGTYGTAMGIANGVVVGAPTGGFKGEGTINAVGVYDDDALLTDYVFDKLFGEDGVYSMRVKEKYDALDVKMFEPATYAKFWKDNGRLYAFPDQNDVIDGVYDKSLGELVQLLIQDAEIKAVHIDAIDQRLTSLENDYGQTKKRMAELFCLLADNSMEACEAR